MKEQTKIKLPKYEELLEFLTIKENFKESNNLIDLAHLLSVIDDLKFSVNELYNETFLNEAREYRIKKYNDHRRYISLYLDDIFDSVRTIKEILKK